jgi:CheY-like chemotaxis protein
MAGKRILVVDDDPMVRQSIELMLQGDANTIELAAAGEEALARFEPGKYHVIVTDNRMPGMSGVQLAAELKARSPEQRVILFSGSPPIRPSSDCDLILIKPFSAVELRKAVSELVDRPKSASVARESGRAN